MYSSMIYRSSLSTVRPKVCKQIMVIYLSTLDFMLNILMINVW